MYPAILLESRRPIFWSNPFNLVDDTSNDPTLCPKIRVESLAFGKGLGVDRLPR